MHIAPKPPLLPKHLHCGQHELTGVIRVLHHCRGEKQTLNVVSAVELNGQLAQLLGGKAGPAAVGGAAVDTVGAVIGAVVAHQHLQQ